MCQAGHGLGMHAGHARIRTNPEGSRLRQILCKVIPMTHKKDVQSPGGPTSSVPSSITSPKRFTLSSDVPSGEPYPKVPISDPHCAHPVKPMIWTYLGPQICSAWRDLARLLRTSPATQVSTSTRTCRVLMCFSRMGGCWYCVFFDEGELHKRLPRRLAFRHPEKIYETARRGHAHLDDPSTINDLELAVASGHGKIWLDLTCEQREALDHQIAA